MSYLLGLDISTTGAKALIIDEAGTVIASHTTAQTLSTPKPLWSEQNPHDWWDGMQQSIRSALQDAHLVGDDIAAVGLTGQMHGLVLLDAGGEVLRPSILWNDQRTQAQCDAITERIGFERLIELTGNRALTGFTAPKILWVREHEPEVYARVAHILLPKDYIRLKLTGEYATDLAGAAGTSLLDVANRTWSQEVIDALEIPSAWLPPTHEGTEITGVISAEATATTGLKAGTPVVGGGGDQAAGAVGVGAVKPSIIALTVGTSGVVFAPLDHYAYEPDGRLHAFCHAVPGMWHFMGVMLSAAGSLQWFHDMLAPNESFDELVATAAEIPPGSEGLLFLPYLTGERTPHPDPLARGAFVGLTVRHTRAHLVRAVLEGVAFGLKDGFELIARAGLPDKIEVRISGGGAKSLLWKQIFADILGATLVTTNSTEGGAFGAALLAAVGANIYPDVATACAQTIQIKDAVTPSEQQLAYEKSYQTYQSLYPALQETFTQL
ncbi:MAG: xylulokinase [Chloroflexi bacterium]|nr:MAG: xylulokinase [Phototrophicales bacterium]RMF79727.1 MAG: xylulokinase [Chloroflexota bacterium]